MPVVRGLANSPRAVVENAQGGICGPASLETLKKINDEMLLTPGVDRAWVKSIWMPVVRRSEVTEEGFSGGVGSCAHSRYNIDNDFIASNFSPSSDVFAVIAKTPVEQCMR
jgi:hypothetical protein